VLYPPSLAADDLAKLVVACVQDGERMRAAQAAAARYVRAHFSVERMTAQYVQVYEQAPFAATTPMARVRARLRFSPVVNWNRYLEHRWGVGQAQYEAMQEFARHGEWHLAVGAARASFGTSPTIYAKPRRLADLLKVRLRGAGHALGGSPSRREA
jgi:hypothetical protein